VSSPSLPDKVVAIDDCFAEGKVAHAFGGALALAYYAEPRATIDIDINVFVDPAEYEAVHAVLAPLGVTTTVDPAAVERDGHCRLWWNDTPVDLFFAYDDIHDAMRGAVRKVPFGGHTLPILSPEHLVVCKALFNRPKDWLDIEQVIVTVADLDLGEIRQWLDRAIGNDDPRARRFDKVASGG
jgi:hypothetical protein